MQLVRCLIHDLEFQLPTTDEEFVSGKLHSEVEICQDHILNNPSCKLVGELNER